MICEKCGQPKNHYKNQSTGTDFYRCATCACKVRSERSKAAKEAKPTTWQPPAIGTLLANKQFVRIVNDACQYKKYADKGCFNVVEVDTGSGSNMPRYAACSGDVFEVHKVVAYGQTNPLTKDWFIIDTYSVPVRFIVTPRKERKPRL